ncbi:MAG: uroporphyrinogen-III synthase [Alphaproteobacteria bacterium]|nr:uroporphyrinogen-III synthase [Alphaproteobacteria bacterium]
MRSVLVTRPQPMADEFAEKLRREGFGVYLAPMMEYVEMEADLDDLGPYQALVFTSAQTVRVFSRRSRERRLPVLAVGDATAETASLAGFTEVYSAKGNGKDVVNLIRAKAKELSLKKVLHPCSENTPHDISVTAGKFGVKIVQRQLYKARFVDRLPDDVLWALQDDNIDTVTLFSARTAANFVRIMQQDNLRGVSKKIRVVCISEQVAAAVKDVPWREVNVSPQPNTGSMLEILKERKPIYADMAPLPVEAVILAFGGIRPLANRLKITSSTVQGWKKRGIIPEIRTEAVLRAAKEDGIDIARLRGKETEKAKLPAQNQVKPPPAGPRVHKQPPQDAILQEKLRFLKRGALTFVVIFIAAGLVGLFLLAPEYSYIKTHPFTFGKTLGSQIRNLTQPLATAASQIETTAFSAGSPQELLSMLNDVAALRQTPEGSAAIAESLKTLHALLAQSPDAPENIDAAVNAARSRDQTLNGLLGQVGVKDVAAGAMLLALNEFRNNFDNHRPYAEDLALLQKLAGNDPETSRALQRLSPYARKGVMSREALQVELKGLAADVVLAKVQGQNVSVKEQALQRLDKLSKSARAGDIQGRETEAVVARAQLLLNQGDVKGAMRELQALEGASAQTVEPWMDNAAGYVIAGQSSDDLTQVILQAVSGGSTSSLESFLSSIKEAISGPDVPYLSPALKNGSGYEGVLPPTAP